MKHTWHWMIKIDTSTSGQMGQYFAPCNDVSDLKMRTSKHAYLGHSHGNSVVASISISFHMPDMKCLKQPRAL